MLLVVGVRDEMTVEADLPRKARRIRISTQINRIRLNTTKSGRISG